MTAYKAKLLALDDYLRRVPAGLPQGNPYLHPAWLAFLNRVNTGGRQPQYVVLISAGERVVLVMALTIRTFWGVRVCVCLDTGFNNNNSPSLDGEACATQGECLWQTIRHGLPEVDLFHFSKQQPRIDGAENPLVHWSKPVKHPNRFYRIDMGSCFDTFEKSRRSNGSLKRLRRKIRRLEETVGPVTLKRATGEADINTSLDAFFVQRAQSEQLGRVPNPFAGPVVQKALRRTALNCAGMTDGLHVFALTAGGQTLAVGLELTSGRAQSGFANSFDSNFSHYSPGRLLEWMLLRFQHQRGIRHVDFGLGDDDYKAEWSDPVWLFNVFHAVGFKGRLLQHLITMRLVALRVLKGQRGGGKAVRKIRLLAARFRRT